MMHSSILVISNVDGISYTRNGGRHYAVRGRRTLTIAEGETVIAYRVGNVHTMYTVDDGMVVSRDYRVGEKF